jgi:hypothetical protein
MIIAQQVKQPEYAVVWNGSAHHPGGRQLFADEHEPVSPPPVAPMRPSPSRQQLDPQELVANLTDAELHAILDLRAAGWLCFRIAEKLHLPTPVVGAAVNAWRGGVNA